MNSVILNRKALLAKKTRFFGRDEEVAHLLLALEHKKGSTSLVSGDRGSGKTSLIDETLDQLKQQLRHDLFARITLPNWKLLPAKLRAAEKSIFPKRARFTSTTVRVPLIPVNTDSEMLKGVILRAIIHALTANRSVSGYFLYPITYNHHLKRLRKMVHYKSRSIERGMSVGSEAGPAKGTLNQVYKSELDLSDIRIELVLASFFQKFAKRVRFVIIFDETDKYEDQDAKERSVTPEKLIYHTKNLFTTNGAHFIFVSTEKYYYELQGRIRSNSRESAHTLFTNALLINHLSPEDFLSSLRSKFENYEEVKHLTDYRQFEQAIMWSSNLYPFEQNKQIAELTNMDGKIIKLSDAADYYSEYWRTYAAMHRLIHRIYNASKKTKDTYYNRYLYRALKELAQFLLTSNKIDGINRRNLAGLVFYNDDFVLGAKKQEFLSTPLSRRSQPMIEVTSWKSRIYELSAAELDKIEASVEDLFWRLDKMSYLSIQRTSNPYTPINIQVNLSSLSFKHVDEGFPNITKPTNKEERLLSKYQLAFTRFWNLNGTAPLEAPNIGAATVHPRDGKWVAELSAKSQRFSEDIKQELAVLEAYDGELRYRLLKSLYEWMRSHHSAEIAVLDLSDNVLTIEDKQGKKMIIVENPTKNLVESSIKTKVKILAIHTFSYRYIEKVRSTYHRKYYLPKDFKGYQTVWTSSRRNIEKYFQL